MLNLKFLQLAVISIGMLMVNTLLPQRCFADEIQTATTGQLAATANRADLNPGLKMDIGLLPIGFKESLGNSIPQRIAIAQAPATTRTPIGLGVTASIGTLGIGADVTKSFTSQFDGRLGFNFGSVGYNRTDSGISYDSTLNLSSFHLFGDYYPFSGAGFRVTGGLVAQNNKFSVTSKPAASGTYTINNTQYSANDVGSLTGEFKYANSIAPYLGIGFGKPASEGFGFNADLGVMFTGAPQVTLNASNQTFNNNPITRAQIDSQVSQTANDLKGFNVYPVLSVGVSYGF